MTQSQPPFPQPQLQPAGITFDQYVEFTLEKLELREGYISDGGQNQLGFHLAVLTNMGLLSTGGKRVIFRFTGKNRTRRRGNCAR